MAVYSEDHPDVIKLGREIEALEKQTNGSGSGSSLFLDTQLAELNAELAALKETYTIEHPDIQKLIRKIAGLQEIRRTLPSFSPANIIETSSNPAYVQTKARLQATQSELQAARQTVGNLTAKIELLEKRLALMPQAEKELNILSRERNVVLGKFNEIRGVLSKAQLSERLDESGKGERFTLVESASMPSVPIQPNRLNIFILGLVSAFAAGFGTAALAEALDPSIYGASGLVKLTGFPPIVLLPFVQTEQDKRRRAGKWISSYTVAFGLYRYSYLDCRQLFHALR